MYFKVSQLEHVLWPCEAVHAVQFEMVSKGTFVFGVNVEALLTCSFLIVSPTPLWPPQPPLDSPKMTLFRFVFLFGAFFFSLQYI